MSRGSFRNNVGAVIVSPDRREVLAFHRIGRYEHGWQFPQGGVEPGEAEDEAILRELEEEIGTRDVSLLASSKSRTRYRYPKRILHSLSGKPEWKGVIGQQQRWYLVHLHAGTDVISFSHAPLEFDAYTWLQPRELLRRLVPFKRKAYKRALRIFDLV